VRVSNADDATLIPSDKNDYVIFGGLTRDVWLRVLPPVSIARLQVSTPEVSRAAARAVVQVELAGQGAGTHAVELVLRAPDGRVAARATANVSGSTARVELPTVRSPRLWSPASPTRYRLTATLSRGGTQVDQVDEHVGFRWFRFEPNGPFYLNGERLLLRGTHRHEEIAGLGAAVPNETHRADLAAIKAMGANFVRLGHYPQDPEVYRAADSLGLLVWDELPWSRGGIGDSTWKAETRRLFAEQIRQNYNHPSIILWSTGNEVVDLLEADDKTPVREVERYMAELTALAHEMDPGRLTATRKFDAGFRAIDVYSPSIWAGWYRGVYRDYEAALVDARAKFPRLFHAEFGADAHVGRHTENPITGAGIQIDSGVAESVGQLVRNIAREGDWSESYQTDLLDWHLMVSERLPWFVGSAQWAFRDFATPLRPDNPIPYVNQKGLVDRSGVPKDAYHVFRSYWTESPKFVHLVSRTWTERVGPAGRPRTVRVYSNCSAVELLANGASQGVRQRDRNDFPSQGLRWSVTFRDGPNALAARCTGAADRAASDTLTVRYSRPAGTASRIELATRRLPNGNTLLEATIVDATGRRVTTFQERVFFSHNGEGALLADWGTPTRSSVIEAANGRAAIELALPPGARAQVLARTQDINGQRLDVVGGR
jgi:beta-galactosidase